MGDGGGGGGGGAGKRYEMRLVHLRIMVTPSKHVALRPQNRGGLLGTGWLRH